MSKVLKFKKLDKDAVTKNSIINGVKVLDKMSRRGMISNIAVVCESSNGQIYYTFNGQNAKNIILGIELLKNALLQSIMKD